LGHIPRRPTPVLGPQGSRSSSLITDRPTYTVVDRRRPSFSGRRCPCLERTTAPRHVCTVSTPFSASGSQMTPINHTIAGYSRGQGHVVRGLIIFSRSFHRLSVAPIYGMTSVTIGHFYHFRRGYLRFRRTVIAVDRLTPSLSILSTVCSAGPRLSSIEIYLSHLV